MEENKIQKPFILEVEEAKVEMVQAINNAMQVHKLPCYILDMILADLVSQIKTGAKNELQMAQEQMMIKDESKSEVE
jgi:hypothetical protein